MSNKFYSRKLTIAVILYVTATIFTVIGMATFEQWASFTKWLFGIYAAGNVGEHFSKITNGPPVNRADKTDH